MDKLIKTETQEWSANLRALETKLRKLEQANKTYLIRELVVTGDRDAVRNLSSWSGYQGYANQELAVADMEAIRERLVSDLRNAGTEARVAQSVTRENTGVEAVLAMAVTEGGPKR